MQVRTWFGIFTLDNNMIIEVELFPKDLGAILDRVLSEPLLLRGKVADDELRDHALKYGFVASGEEYDTMLHELNIRLAKKKITQSMTPDRQIIAAVEAIDDIDETGNILAERLREWYLLNFNETTLKGSDLAHYILEMKEPAPELTIMQSLASGLLGLYGSRLSIEEYLKKNMQKTAPNLTSIAGYMLGARLLSISGGLPKLASMPSSTVQVIGASNALFKHLRGKAPSPKHGAIFRHPYINTAPKRLRGKIARAVAAKISLAARYDMYSGKINESLPYELEKKVARIRKQAKK
jgi:nucleolar protein 56